MTSQTSSSSLKSQSHGPLLHTLEDFLIFSDKPTEFEKTCFKCKKVTQLIFAETVKDNQRKSFCSSTCFEEYLNFKFEKTSEYQEDGKKNEIRFNLPIPQKEDLSSKSVKVVKTPKRKQEKKS